jgi:ABC-type transporter Mla subunit MlaD
MNMKVIVAISALLICVTGVWANPCDDLAKLFDDGFPKVGVLIDKASQAANAKELASALNQVADSLTAYRQKFTAIVTDAQKKSSNGNSGLDDCTAALHRFRVFLKQLQAGVDELKVIFPKYASDADVTAAFTRIQDSTRNQSPSPSPSPSPTQH